jgi:isochorismate hydrolase
MLMILHWTPKRKLFKEIGVEPYSKTCFSMAIPEVLQLINNEVAIELQYSKLKYFFLNKYWRSIRNRFQVSHVVLCGVEAHACIQATALDFLNRGFKVSIKILKLAKNISYCST